MDNSFYSFLNKQVSVYGYGIEGRSTVQFLLQEGVNKITIYDDKLSATELEHTVLSLHDSKVQARSGPFISDESDVLFRSPSLRIDLPVFVAARNQGKRVTSTTNEFMRRCPGKIIGVTGTKGKGTTSALLTEMLREDGRDVYLGGNIGTPPLDFLRQLTEDSWVVLEMSSFQLWDLEFSPSIAVIVMVTIDHLDVHANEYEYLMAKANMLRFQDEQSGAIVANWDHMNSRKIADTGRSSLYKTSLFNHDAPGAYVDQQQIIIHDGVNTYATAVISDIALIGPHNVQNALSSAMAAFLAGCSIDSIKKGLQHFRGLPHRLEMVGEWNHVLFYDDSFSTTPETAIAAIQSFSQHKIVILGGSSKQSDFQELGKIINASNSIRAIIGIGDEWQRIKPYLDTSTMTIIEGCTTMEQIVAQATAIAQKGDVVLLSPACASFGMFANYKDRGDQFKKEVAKIIQQS